MKKNTLIRSIAIIGAFMFAIPAFASTTASLAPATINVTPGQKFNVVITVNPSIANYAEKIELNYPKDVLEVNSFTFAPTWMQLTQPGYDSNTEGVLIKTAGYPAGITAPTVFGTVSFTAKKAGNGTIKIGANSLAFEATAQTSITGVGASFTIASPVVTPKVTPKKEEKKVEIKKEEKKETATTSEQTEKAVAEQNDNKYQAAVVEAVPATEEGNKLPLTAGVIIVVGIIGAIAYVFYRKGKQI